jgi:CheY-like chemotaxis protein
MDGREVLSKLKHDAALKSIPIIVLTTSTAEEDILRSYDLHANCYITKPSDLDQFITALQAIEAFWFSVVTLPPNDETHHGEQSDQLPHGKTPRSQDA